MATENRGTSLWVRIGGSAVGILALLAVLIAANVLASRMRIRADMTGEKLYTLSKGTRAVLAKLEDPVTLHFFFSGSANEMPEFLRTYARQVEDLLREYAAGSHGQIRLVKHDPKPDTDEEELAENLGIAGQPLGMTGPSAYFGIAAKCGDAEASIPVLDPRTDTLLEYNLTRMIYRVAHPAKPVLGVLSSLPVMGRAAPPFMMPGQRPPNEPPWIVFRELKEDYDVREIEPGANRIDDEIEVLVVLHPKELPDSAQFAIDQFVLRGGRLFVFVDPLCLNDMDNPTGQPFAMGGKSSDLPRLFAAWGVAYDPGKVVADMDSTTRVRGRDGRAEDSPVYISLRADNVATGDVMTAQIESLLMAGAGSFSGDGAQGLTVTPLIRSSQRSATLDAFLAQGDAESIRRQFKSGMKNLNLAVRLSGKFRTAFPDGAPAAPAASTNGTETAVAESPASLKEGVKETTVILVADADMLYDAFWSRSIPIFGYNVSEPFNENAGFFANGVELLAGSADFVDIRCRGRIQRPFARVLALRGKAEQHWMMEELALQQRIEDTQKRLADLQGQKDDKQRFILSPEQEREMETFKKQLLESQKDLRTVRRNLREGIEKLGVWVKVLNIVVVPALVCVGGLGFWLFRRSRTRNG